MNKHINIEDVRKLPIAERLRLLEDVWASLDAESTELAVPEWHKSELDRRLESYRAQPEKTKSWQDVKAELLETLHK